MLPSGGPRDAAPFPSFHHGARQRWREEAREEVTTMKWVLASMLVLGVAAQEGGESKFTESFGESDGDLGPTGTNPYFILEPGYVLVLEGKEDESQVTITITVLDQTRKIGGIEARAVEEREVHNGVLHEITRDYFAISRRTNNVYYLGEDVDEYKDGKVVSHGGTWWHGEKGAHYGLIMPAVPLLGAHYQQEIAPGVAMDRAQVVSLSDVCECPAGKFDQVLVTEESTPLEQGKESKRYARGV